MAAAPRKVCLLGAGSVGKSRLARRIAFGSDDCSVQTRSGSQVLDVSLRGRDDDAVPVRLFDGPGRTLLDSLSQPLLTHASAWLLVADGTRRSSIDLLSLLHAGATAVCGARPALVLLNKSDLDTAAWHPGDLQQLAALGPVHVVSAVTGEGLDAAMAELAGQLRLP